MDRKYTATGFREEASVIVEYTRPSSQPAETIYTAHAAIPAERQVYSAAEYSALQQKVGELTAELAALQASPVEAALPLAPEPTMEAPKPPEVLSVVVPKILEQDEPSNNGHVEVNPSHSQVSHNGDASETTTATLEVLPEQASNQELSPAQARYEKTILFLLDQPAQRVDQPQVSSWLREELGFDSREWNSTLTVLRSKFRILQFYKDSPTARHATSVGLDINMLRTHAHMAFYTERVKIKIAEQEAIQEESIEEKPQVLNHGDEVVISQQPQPISRPTTPGKEAPQISKRVARMMEKNADPVPGYRREPKPHSFLTHRRETLGAKKRHRQ